MPCCYGTSCRRSGSSVVVCELRSVGAYSTMEAVPGPSARSQWARNHHPALPVFAPSYIGVSSSVEEALARIRFGRSFRDQFCPLLSSQCSKKCRSARVGRRRQRRLLDAGFASCVASSTSRDVVPRHYSVALRDL